MTADEQAWYEDRQRYGWVLPRKAAWPLRLPGIRRVRAVYHAWRAERQVDAWARIGIGIAGVSAYDRWVVYAIARGWC